MQVIAGVIFPETTEEAIEWFKKKHPSKRLMLKSVVSHLAAHMAHTLKHDTAFCRSNKEFTNPFADSGVQKHIDSFNDVFANTVDVKLY